jgi:hypothetical protein
METNASERLQKNWQYWKQFCEITPHENRILVGDKVHIFMLNGIVVERIKFTCFLLYPRSFSFLILLY